MPGIIDALFGKAPLDPTTLVLTSSNVSAAPRQSMAKIKEKVFINNWVEPNL